MNPVKLIIPVIAITTTIPTAAADITHIEDHRSAYATASVSQEENVFDIQYSNPNLSINEQIELANTDSLTGSASSLLSYQSDLSFTQFSSSASISSTATTFGSGLNAWSNAGFRNNIVFTLDSTTTFSIAGFISGSSNTGGTHLFVDQLDEHGEIADQIFHRSALGRSLDIHSTLILAPGSYSFSAYSYSFAGTLDFNTSDSNTSAHNITVTVVPAPASAALLFLTGSTLLTRRRR